MKQEQKGNKHIDVIQSTTIVNAMKYTCNQIRSQESAKTQWPSIEVMNQCKQQDFTSSQNKTSCD